MLYYTPLYWFLRASSSSCVARGRGAPMELRRAIGSSGSIGLRLGSLPTSSSCVSWVGVPAVSSGAGLSSDVVLWGGTIFCGASVSSFYFGCSTVILPSVLPKAAAYSGSSAVGSGV